MKNSAVLGLVLFFLCAFVYCSATCEGLNPFLDHLRHFRGIVLSHPHEAIHSSCGQEWDKHGTCCNIEPLRKYAVSDKQAIETAVTRVFQSLDKAVRSTQLLYHRYQTLARDFGDTGKQLVKMRRESNKKITKHLAGIIKGQLSSCADKVAHARSISLCYICSSNSKEYFLKEKALVNRDLCDYYLHDCVNPIFLILNMIEEINRVVDFTKANLKDIYHNSTNQKYEDELIHTRNKLFSNEEFKVITDYLQVSDDANKTPFLTKVCGLLVSLSHKTFIQKMAKVLEDYIVKLTVLTEKIQRHLVSNFKKQTRNSRALLLESHQPTNGHENVLPPHLMGDNRHHVNSSTEHETHQKPIIEDILSKTHIHGDVVMFSPANKDSSYTSFFGTLGSSNNENTEHIEPMPINLTMLFP